MTASLLPSSAGPVERTLTVAAGDTLPVPVAQILDPAETPAEFLAFLAAHEGVRLWFADWPEARKRQIIADWPRLASLIGTRAAAEAFLAYVDTTIVHQVTYPARFPVGKIVAGAPAVARLTPIQHKPFTARYLLKLALTTPVKAICVARTAVGCAAVHTFDREPLRRAKLALSTAKAPETAYSVNFAHRIRRSLDDGLDLDAGFVFGSYKDRVRL